MPVTYKKIASVTVGSGGAANIEFTSIPGTYTDLVIKFSTRVDTNDSTRVDFSFNGSTSNFTNRWLFGNGSTASSFTNFGRGAGQSSVLGDTASTFSNNDVYIPNYAGSTNKSYSADGVTETNGSQAYQSLIAGLWSDTAAITSVRLTPGVGNFVQHSTATLYGIEKS
jgi:hypothetical protein